MAKSRIGPFALEAPLSKAKPSGQVFRGIHLEQKKLAALRVFPVPMGMTPESRQAYASQLEQLKQLRHPGVVRCFGGGFDTRSAFLAYELIDGESLADLLSRRGRLPWETSLDLGLQLASALEYAHEMGWVHGRLEPSKILISNDQQAKIIDFRRNEIASMLSGPKTLALLACSAPEVLQNGLADEKSDLYSLGAILFQMLTGKPPYAAATLMELQQLVSAQEVPRVGAEVLDCPVWFSAIVEQLLSKDPKQRPYSTRALQLALKEAQKRQNEGVGVLQHATAGFSPLQMKVDRAEAEKVLGIKKPKKRRKGNDTSFFENPWVLLIAFVLAVGGAVWFMLPLSEEALRSESETLLASEEWIDWNDARDTYLKGLIERFPTARMRNGRKRKLRGLTLAKRKDAWIVTSGLDARTTGVRLRCSTRKLGSMSGSVISKQRLINFVLLWGCFAIKRVMPPSCFWLVRVLPESERKASKATYSLVFLSRDSPKPKRLMTEHRFLMQDESGNQLSSCTKVIKRLSLWWQEHRSAWMNWQRGKLEAMCWEHGESVVR